MQQQTGFLNIPDQRVFVPYGRIPEPEDILGSVRLQDGKVVENTYERMPTHRIISSNGVVELSEEMESILIDELEKLPEEEQTK